jgi:hypothetical protein
MVIGIEINFWRPHACQAYLLGFTLCLHGFFHAGTIGEPAKFKRADATLMHATAHPAAPHFLRRLTPLPISYRWWRQLEQWVAIYTYISTDGDK